MGELPFSKKLLFGSITVVISIVLAFTVLETIVRSTQPDIDLYNLTGRSAGPNPISEWAFVDAFCAYRARPGQYAEGKTVNSHGFLSTPPITSHKSQGTVRIVFLGGSSTAGTGKNLADAQTWPWQTVEMLRDELPVPVDFINAALGGYTSFESCGRLWSRIRHFSPDIVVVCHGWNEMYYFPKSDSILGWRTLQDGSWSLEKMPNPIPIYEPHWVDPVIKWSQGMSWIRLRLSRPHEGEIAAEQDQPLKTDFNHNGIAIWRTNLRLLRETCSVIGAEIFVAKQPTLIVPGLPPGERERCRYEYHGFDHDTHIDAFSEIYEVIDEEIPERSVIDLTPLSGRAEYFFDHVHPTQQGSRETASIVSESLRAHILQMNIDPTSD